MKVKEAWGLFCGDEWQRQYGCGSKEAMQKALKIANENGDALELKKFRSECGKKTIFGKVIDKYGITCYMIHKDTGICESTLHNWKKGLFRPNPYDENYKKVLDYIKNKTGEELTLLDFVHTEKQ